MLNREKILQQEQQLAGVEKGNMGFSPYLLSVCFISEVGEERKGEEGERGSVWLLVSPL